MSRIERGGANPSLDAIEALADVHGVDVATLFESSNPSLIAKKGTSITVPFAADGTCFNPSLKRKRTDRFTVGEKGNLVNHDTFEAALEYLTAMKPRIGYVQTMPATGASCLLFVGLLCPRSNDALKPTRTTP